MTKPTPLIYQGEPVAGRMPPFRPKLRAQIRAGKKTATRRLLKPQPDLTALDDSVRWSYIASSTDPKSRDKWQGCVLDLSPAGNIYTVRGKERQIWQGKCPYGFGGDLRFLIEPLCKGPDSLAYYADDMQPVYSWQTEQPIVWRWEKPTLTSIHMPTEAARTWVKVERIHIERVNEITEEQAKAEGVKLDDYVFCTNPPFIRYGTSHKECFPALWEEIHGPGAWHLNPVVWVINFDLFPP